MDDFVLDLTEESQEPKTTKVVESIEDEFFDIEEEPVKKPVQRKKVEEKVKKPVKKVKEKVKKPVKIKKVEEKKTKIKEIEEEKEEITEEESLIPPEFVKAFGIESEGIVSDLEKQIESENIRMEMLGKSPTTFKRPIKRESKMLLSQDIPSQIREIGKKTKNIIPLVPKSFQFRDFSFTGQEMEQFRDYIYTNVDVGEDEVMEKEISFGFFFQGENGEYFRPGLLSLESFEILSKRLAQISNVQEKTNTQVSTMEGSDIRKIQDMETAAIVFQRKQRDYDSAIDIKRFGIRMYISTETQLPSNSREIKRFQPTQQRKRYRTSFSGWKEGINVFDGCRVDMTRVLEIRKTREITHHEVEIEIIDNENKKSEQELADMISFVMSSMYCISPICPEIEKMRHEEVEYAVSELNKLIYPSRRQNNAYRLSGGWWNKPKNIKIPNLFEESIKFNQSTVKLNGTRRFLFTTNEGIYLLGPPFDVFRVADSIPALSGSLIDGEFMHLYKKTDAGLVFSSVSYFAFDILFLNYSDVRRRPLSERVEFLRSTITLIQSSTTSGINFCVKNFYSEGNFYSNVLKAQQEGLKLHNKFALENNESVIDGIIFQSSFYYVNQNTYKFKPPSQLTIDFKVISTQEPGKYQIFVGKEREFAEDEKLRAFERVKFSNPDTKRKLGDEYVRLLKVVAKYPFNRQKEMPSSMEETQLAKVSRQLRKLKSREPEKKKIDTTAKLVPFLGSEDYPFDGFVEMGDTMDDNFIDQQIVEFAFENDQFIPSRIRLNRDKPNEENVAADVWEDIQNPTTIETLKGGNIKILSFFLNQRIKKILENMSSPIALLIGQDPKLQTGATIDIANFELLQVWGGKVFEASNVQRIEGDITEVNEQINSQTKTILCLFSVSQFYETSDKLDEFIDLLDKTYPGGRVIIFTLDGETVMSNLEGKDKLDFESFKIEKGEWNGQVGDYVMITTKLEEEVQTTEYLVNCSVLSDGLLSRGFKVIYNTHLTDGEGNKMSQQAELLPDQSQLLGSFIRVIVFEKGMPETENTGLRMAKNLFPEPGDEILLENPFNVNLVYSGVEIGPNNIIHAFLRATLEEYDKEDPSTNAESAK